MADRRFADDAITQDDVAGQRKINLAIATLASIAAASLVGISANFVATALLLAAAALINSWPA